MKEVAYLVSTLLWVMGFVLAKGIWSTVFCIIPFWAFYLDIEFILNLFGVL